MTHEKFQIEVSDYLEEIKQMLYKKNEKYGNSVFQPINIFSKQSHLEQIKTRIDDKLNRLKLGSEYENEDTVTDLIGYLVIYKIAERENG